MFPACCFSGDNRISAVTIPTLYSISHTRVSKLQNKDGSPDIAVIGVVGGGGGGGGGVCVGFRGMCLGRQI